MSESARFEPFFLDGNSGRLFCVHHAPPGPIVARALLHLPAFGDEMNRSRRMVSLGARAFVAAGLGVLVMDPFGTGDSDGEHADATWDAWLDDVRTALEWLRVRGYQQVWLWGLRLGALLALDALEHEAKADALMLWSPVVNGENYLTQVLRLRVASAKLRDESGESVKALKEQLAAGEPVEVGGYALNPGLAQRLAGVAMRPGSPPAANRPVRWFDVSAGESGELPPASARVVAGWREAGMSLDAASVGGEPFWSTQEIGLAPRLVDVSTAALGGPTP